MPGAETKRASPSKASPSKASPPSKPPVGDDRNARTDDDYYHYYLNSQRRVSKWINQTKQEMQLDGMSEISGVNDEYPASNLDFGTVTGSVAGETSSTISRSTLPTTVTGRGEGGSKAKEASPTQLREKEARRKLREILHPNGTTDEEMYETATAEVKSQASTADSVTTANTALPKLTTRKSSKHPFKLELDGSSTVLAYPDMRARTVVTETEPTFTEVMHRLGTRNAVFGSEPSLATGVTSTTRLTERTGRTERTERERLRSSKSKRSSSETPAEFELSWSVMQPVLLILSSSTLVVVLVPAAAAAVVVVALIAIAYSLDLIPDMTPSSSRRKSSSSSSDRHRSSRSSRRSR